MRKTKIVCTLGPASESEEMIRQLMLEGMNVARFNFSHGDHEEQLRRLQIVKKVREELNLPVGSHAGYQGAGDPSAELQGSQEGAAERGPDVYADHR